LNRSRVETLGWAVLGLLLAATLVLALLFDRAKLPLHGDEATYAMQAASVAWDFDLAYSRADFDRFVEHWGSRPEGLILQSREGSERLVYAKPPLYALVTAPFVRLAPVRGGPIANALLLAVAALLAAVTLQRQIGPAAPLWVAVLLFASIAFSFVFWGEADLFLFAATVAGFALAYRGDRTARSPLPSIYEGETTERPGRLFARWFGAGLLLAVAGAYRPFYLALLLPAFLAARTLPAERRRAGTVGLIAGAAVLLLISGGLQWISGGDWTGYGGQRQGIYHGAGFPEVDFQASRWSQRVESRGNASWLQAGAVEPEADLKVLGWNALYFLAGRHVGILPYFLPLLLGFAAYRGDRGRWAILLAVLAGVAAFLLFRPFDFSGGSALGNRYFLPLYAALWFLAARPARPVWALLAAALAAPFLYTLWLHPTAPPVADGGRLRHVSPVAQRWLPYETTQNTAPGREIAQRGLWLKLLDNKIWQAPGGQRLRIAGDARGELLLGSPEPLGAVILEFDRQAPTRLEVGGTELRPALLKADGSVAFQVPLADPRAVHPMWWTGQEYQIHHLDLRLPGAPSVPIGFRIVLVPLDLIQKSGG
jgi:hypothetical protein